MELQDIRRGMRVDTPDKGPATVDAVTTGTIRVWLDYDIDKPFAPRSREYPPHLLEDRTHLAKSNRERPGILRKLLDEAAAERSARA